MNIFILVSFVFMVFQGTNGCGQKTLDDYDDAVARTIQHISDERTIAGRLIADATIPALRDVFDNFNRVLDLKKPVYLAIFKLGHLARLFPPLCIALKIFTKAADAISPIVVGAFNAIHEAIRLLIRRIPRYRRTARVVQPIKLVLDPMAEALDMLRIAVQKIADAVLNVSDNNFDEDMLQMIVEIMRDVVKVYSKVIIALKDVTSEALNIRFYPWTIG